MKKFLIKLCLIFLLCVSVIPNLAQGVYCAQRPEKVKVTLATYIYSEIYVEDKLQEPTLTNPLIQVDGKDFKLAVHTELTVDVSYSNDMFYRINLFNVVPEKTENDFGFVLIAHTMNSKDNSPIKKLDFNAKVKNDNSQIYTKNSLGEFSPDEFVLNKNTQVRILDGYDKKKEYTYISFYNENNDIVSNYIKTSDLSVSGVNYSLIIGILSLISCVSVILIVFGIKGKKKNKIKKNK